MFKEEMPDASPAPANGDQPPGAIHEAGAAVAATAAQPPAICEPLRYDELLVHGPLDEEAQKAAEKAAEFQALISGGVIPDGYSSTILPPEADAAGTPDSARIGELTLCLELNRAIGPVFSRHLLFFVEVGFSSLVCR